jgi:hypothetical protein
MGDIKMSDFVWKSSIVFLGILVVFGWLSNYVIVPLMRKVAKAASKGEITGWTPHGGQWVGVIERFLYVITLGAGVYGFVVIWLLLKASVIWMAAKDGSTRFPFNLYLFGTSMSLLVGVLGALLGRILVQAWGVHISILPE